MLAVPYFLCSLLVMVSLGAAWTHVSDTSDPEQSSSFIHYIMTELFGWELETSLDSPMRSLDKISLFARQQLKNQEIDYSSPHRNQRGETWHIDRHVRGRRSKANPVHWFDLTRMTGQDSVDEDLLPLMVPREELSRVRVRRDTGTSTPNATQMFVTVNGTINSVIKSQLETMAGSVVKSYLESYSSLQGKIFNVTVFNIQGNTLQMYVETEELDYYRKQLAQALSALDTKVLRIGQVYVQISSPELETSAGVLQAAICFLCASYQTCVQDSSLKSWSCRLLNQSFYAFGLPVGDKQLPKDIEEAAVNVTIESFFPFGDEFVDMIWISVNGIISFKDKFTSFAPIRLPVRGPDGKNRMLLAVYWCDLDLSSSDKGQVFYQHYTRKASMTNQELDLFLKVSQTIMMYAPSTFNATDVVVITWDDVAPWPANMSSDERVTFQCVIMTDGSVTYVQYLYGQGAMQLKPVNARPVEVGWGRTNLDTNRLNYYVFDTIIGNTNDERGQWIFKIGEKTNYRKMCLDWTKKNNLTDINTMNQQVPACPCSEVGANISVFWVLSREERGCYDMFPSMGRYGRRCCYRQDRSGGFETRIPAAGSFQTFTPNFGDLIRHKSEDTDPKRWCCQESNLCSVYYLYRPARACVPRNTARGNFYGDPHITTLDNKTFTFNGLGEFTLLAVNGFIPGLNRIIRVQLQGRTCNASNNGEPVNATVFCALALRTSLNTKLMVEISQNGKNLVIILNEYDYSRQFQLSASFSASQSDIVLSKQNGSLYISTTDDIGLTVTFHDGILDFTLEIDTSYRGFTTGLIGNFNGNPGDDLIFPNGTFLPDTSSEKQLFDYAWTWAVKDSVFRYWNNLNTSFYARPNKVPQFLKDVISKNATAYAEKLLQCGGLLDCAFDFLATNNRSFADKTKETTVGYASSEKTISNNPPTVNGNQSVLLLPNQTVTISLFASDADGDFFNFEILEQPNNTAVQLANKSSPQLPSSISVSSENYTIEITVVGEVSGNLAYVLTDLKGGKSFSQLSYIYCPDCSSHGTCDLSNPQPSLNSPYTSYATCGCDDPWSGSNCENDKDGCVGLPCPEDTNCTDVPASQERDNGTAYMCSDCPLGSVLNSNGTKCEDINECLNGSNPCINSQCINTIGSFQCNCTSGYRQASHTVCTDINECTDMKQNCPQVCINTPGSYQCECEVGFQKSGVMGLECVKIDTDPCSGLVHNCSYGCRNNSGTAECFCRKGEKVASDGSSCQDIDECKEKICSQNCTNTFGGFSCSCFVGYTLGSDGLSCVACASNFYGKDCKTQCDCRSRATSCNSVRGCLCQPPWTGVHCETSLDLCSTLTLPCPSGQICQNSMVLGTYQCLCPPGYDNPFNNGTCYNIDECVTSQNRCPPRDCVDTIGSFQCVCQRGYTYKSSSNTCKDVNECELGVSGCQQKCQNLPGSFKCDCNDGFILTDDRATCIKDINVNVPCFKVNNNCTFGCNLVDGKPDCYCGFGFRLATDNISCVDINECLESSPCNGTAQCHNRNGSFTCQCPEGSRLLEDGSNCQKCGSNYWGSSCNRECNCYPFNSASCEVFTGCKCIPGWGGEHCEQDVDECSSQVPPCLKAHRCLNTFGSYRCGCNAGFAYHDSTDSCYDIDECLNSVASPCDQYCNNTVGSFLCSCMGGFIAQGATCQDFDECAVPQLNGCDQSCRNTEGSFMCDCFEGYLLNTTSRNTCYRDNRVLPCNGTKNCSDQCVRQGGQETCVCGVGFRLNPADNLTCLDINECDPRPGVCINGTCLNTPGNFECTCGPGLKLATDRLTCQVCDTGYYGSNCGSLCTCNTSNTDHCSPVNGSCFCYDGWTGSECSQDVDECTSGQADCSQNSVCNNSPGSYRCVCRAGFFRSANECIACDALHYGVDCRQDCLCVTDNNNTQDCQDNNGTCLCNPGWMGSTCETDVDECLNASLCSSPHLFCLNLNGSYECLCDDGYALNPDALCQDINECLDSTINNCSEPRVCNNTDGSFQCSCLAGYSEVNGLCLPTFKKYTVNSTLDFSEPVDPLIFNSSTIEFREMKAKVDMAFYNKGRSVIHESLASVNTTRFINGSVIAETIFIMDERYTNNTARVLSELVLKLLKDGVLLIQNYTVKVVKVTRGTDIFTSNSSGCDIFTAFNSCSLNEMCKETSGQPRCEPAPSKSKTDHEALIIGLSVGLSLFVLLVLAVAIITYCCVKRRAKNVQRNSNLSPYYSNVRTPVDNASTPPGRDFKTSSLPTRMARGSVDSNPIYGPPDYPMTEYVESRSTEDIYNRWSTRDERDHDFTAATPIMESWTPGADFQQPRTGFFSQFMDTIYEAHKEVKSNRPKINMSQSQARQDAGGPSNSSSTQKQQAATRREQEWPDLSIEDTQDVELRPFHDRSRARPDSDV